MERNVLYEGEGFLAKRGLWRVREAPDRQYNNWDTQRRSEEWFQKCFGEEISRIVEYFSPILKAFHRVKL